MARMEQIFDEFLYEFEKLEQDTKHIPAKFIDDFKCIVTECFDMDISTKDNKIFCYYVFKKCYNKITKMKNSSIMYFKN